MGACKHWFSTTNRCHDINLASGSAGTATIHMWRPLGEWHHKRRCRSIVVQSNADDDQESRSVGISAPLLPKLGKYDVRVALVCICIWQVDLRLTLSTYWLAQNAPVCICSGSQTFWTIPGLIAAGPGDLSSMHMHTAVHSELYAFAYTHHSCVLFHYTV